MPIVFSCKKQALIVPFLSLKAVFFMGWRCLLCP